MSVLVDQEKAFEIKEDYNHEQLMKNDWDYFLKNAGVCKEMSVEEFSKALKLANELGWEISAQELMEDAMAL